MVYHANWTIFCELEVLAKHKDLDNVVAVQIKTQ